tara:strand:+ start:31 stop:531 length:501 start_codon:yes stop_codon:yes gene_type:complete
MKLFGKFNEYTLNDIYLYGTPSHIIKGLITKSDTEIIVKEYKPKAFKQPIKDDKGKIIGEKKIIQDKSYRHQVVAIQNLGFAKISVYSVPLGYKEIEELKLEPIDKAIKKEKLELSLEKFTNISPKRGTKIKQNYSNKKEYKPKILRSEVNWKTFGEGYEVINRKI